MINSMFGPSLILIPLLFFSFDHVSNFLAYLCVSFFFFFFTVCHIRCMKKTNVEEVNTLYL